MHGQWNSQLDLSHCQPLSVKKMEPGLQQNTEWCVHYCFTPLGGTLNLFMHSSVNAIGWPRWGKTYNLFCQNETWQKPAVAVFRYNDFQFCPFLSVAWQFHLQDTCRTLLRMPQRAGFGPFSILTLCVLHQFFRLIGETWILLFVYGPQTRENFVLRV